MNQLTERIIRFNKSRIADLVRLKYKFMSENEFRFYRGTCHLFYEDLHKNPISTNVPAGWICGDLHLENFGTYSGVADQVYFDLNDFDEGVLAPVTWELIRFITSIYVSFDSLEIERRKADKMAELYLKTYSSTLANGKADYVEKKTAGGIIRDFLNIVDERNLNHLLAKKTTVGKKGLQFERDSKKHLEIDPEIKVDLFHHVNDWLRNDEKSPYNYKVCDGIFRVAGTGSVGLKRYAFILKTLNRTGEEYILVDMKQANRPSLSPYLIHEQPAWTSEADRIICIQQKMQNKCPALLSTSFFEGDHYIMQEMQPTEDRINFKLLKKKYRDMYQVVKTMAMLTASAQLRSSGQNGSAITDELKAFGAETGWHREVFNYSAEYSLQVKKDYAAFITDYPSLKDSASSQPGQDSSSTPVVPLKVAL